MEEFQKDFEKNFVNMLTAAGINGTAGYAYSPLGREWIITVILPGDANYDGIIDIRDFIHMKSIIAGNFAENKASDVDKSGNVSATDLAELKKMLLGIKN